MIETITIWHIVIGAAVPLISVLGAWFTLKAKVGELERLQDAHKQEMDARFQAGINRDLVIETQLADHVRETARVREDIAEIKTDLKHIVRYIERNES